jgi:hypothetical protein
MWLRSILTFLILLTLSSTAFSQDKVQLLNGKILEGTVESTADEQIKMKVTDKKG